ncbi:MAG: ABC transporter ATP-binding protein [Candidatus Carbobacillus altaicus]|nr:ABC transporter ATP-binding protein [Candidatus Carbobacillus altaicus]
MQETTQQTQLDSPPSTPVIQLANVSKRYGFKTAVDHLNLTIYEGEVFGLLGPNGAGKTTTILMLLGLIEPTEGQAYVLDIDATRNPLKVKERVGYLPDDVGFYEDLTGRENLLLTARLNGLTEEEAAQAVDQLLKRVGLEAAADQKAGTYSRGMRQRLGLADTLIKRPRIIILDEPTLGIDPEGVREFLALIRSLSQEEGITVLLSSHHLHQVQAICDRVGLFIDGRLLAVGTIADLAQKLFKDAPYQLKVEAEPLGDGLLANLMQLPGIASVERISPTSIRLLARENTASDVAETIFKSGSKLYALESSQFGLDEIYHRFFAGREGT